MLPCFALASCSCGCRASIPVTTCVLASCIECKVPSPEEAASLIIISFGVMMSVWEEHLAGSASSIMLCFSSTVCTAAMMCITGRVLSDKLDVLQLNLYTASICCAFLMPIFMLREVSCLVEPNNDSC